MTSRLDPRRIFVLNDRPLKNGPVIYWLSREQRAADNWSLLYAQELAQNNHQPLIVAFCLAPAFLGATRRQYGFMLRGLAQAADALAKLNIPFQLLPGEPAVEISRFAAKINAGAVVTDFDPLRIKRQWQGEAARRLSCVFYEVDAHNIVPIRLASVKQEFGAYTLRPKIKRLLPEFLVDFPKLKKQAEPVLLKAKKINWEKVLNDLPLDDAVPEVAWRQPGERAAHREMNAFISERLASYDQSRNDPNLDGQSGLSPYLHFGQLSAQRLAWEVKRSAVSSSAKEAFLEELIVRRELADNFCHYNPEYDRPAAWPAWAKKSLEQHADDPRPYLYSKRQLERGRTHDDLWNAAQREMAVGGKMHGYMRMYWAKKILEWTKSPAEAQRIAIYLNDKYELDGRDPNGYAGIAWSIGGLHDRAWFDRPVFGKIRYMNYRGCSGKFDIKAYLAKIKEL